MAEIIDGVTGRMHRALYNHHLRVEMPDDLPLIPVDYVQIEQVFTNLISNSTKYAPAGTEILLRFSLEGGDWLLARITNQGPPVASEHLARIFDKFYRVTDAEKVSGTGLGLSICKGIIEAHEGMIWAENLPEGFTFSIKLPVTLAGKRAPEVRTEA
jgi:two-component system sensor histidine kinase KdpD